MPKPKINPYLLFMQEMRTQQPGWGNKSNQELMTLASPLWDGLGQERRDEYSRRAKKMRGLEPSTGRVGSGAKDSMGRDLEDLRARDLERERTVKRKIRDLDDLIDQQVENDSLEDCEFYVMHTNIFAKTLQVQEKEAAYIPAEICISKFSLKAGLMATYQSFPKVPAVLPQGYKWECVQQSEALKTPLTAEEGFTVADDGVVVPEIQKFLGNTKTCFLMPEFEEQCKGVLEGIAKRSCQPPFNLSYLSLPGLLYKLKTGKCKAQQEKMLLCPSVNMAERELELEKFLYWAGLACDWHENVRPTDKCCQSSVARRIFTILENCCPVYNIEMVPGQHAPRTPDIVKSVTWTGGSIPRRTGGSGFSVTENGYFGGKDIRYKDCTASIATTDSYQQYLESTECESSCSVATTESSYQDVESLAERLSEAGGLGVRRDSQQSELSRSSLGRGMLLKRRLSAMKKPGDK